MRKKIIELADCHQRKAKIDSAKNWIADASHVRNHLIIFNGVKQLINGFMKVFYFQS